jgi:glycerol dehydrogenase-like iron-containing ADH family enzyme
MNKMLSKWGAVPGVDGTVIAGPDTGNVFAGSLFNCDFLVLKKSERNPADLLKKVPALKKSPLIAAGSRTIIESTKFLAGAAGVDWISIPTALTYDGVASGFLEDGTSAPKPIGVFGVKTVLENNSLNRLGRGYMLSKYSQNAEKKLMCRREGRLFTGSLKEIIGEAKKDDEGLFRAVCMYGEADAGPPGSEKAIADFLPGECHGYKRALCAVFVLGLYERMGMDGFLDVFPADLLKALEKSGLPKSLDEISVSRKEFVGAVAKASAAGKGILAEAKFGESEVLKVLKDIDI